MNFRIDFLKKQWKNSNPKFKRIKCSWWVWKEAFLIRVLHSQTSVFFEISFSHFPTNPPPLDSQNFPSSNSHVKFKNFWWKLDQDLELILFKDLSSQLSSKVLNWFFKKISVLNCCRNFCSNDLNWLLNQFWSKFCSNDLNQFWSKGSLKSVVQSFWKSPVLKLLNWFSSKLWSKFWSKVFEESNWISSF